MSAKTVTWDSIRSQVLADPNVKAEYDALAEEFSLARLIIALRETVGLTQREFADRIGIKQSQLARIESGRQTPKLETLAKLAAGADYDIEVNLVPRQSHQSQERQVFQIPPKYLSDTATVH